ncbi:hypothetical protein [Phreatobacter cathodiphilus]|uniref:Uncharacterized protein n=1 Tax=Phreatobacter cathodiphilus TaxID=1868589 RepID=A0A2S0N9H0_9HYPH|nr:hypothetical protein [Phreatobacter cathodiphilus]AVO44573.1 hypothetical protein C6569_05585 [Phreatobacter cathodiphilus]
MTAWPFAQLVPSTLSQSILPGWGASNVTINYQGSPDIETEVIRDVASFGRQIGWLTEMLLAQRDGDPAKAAGAEAKLREAAAKIEAVKERRAASARTAAAEALERFRSEHPDRYARFVLDRAAEVKASTGEAAS